MDGEFLLWSFQCNSLQSIQNMSSNSFRTVQLWTLRVQPCSKYNGFIHNWLFIKENWLRKFFLPSSSLTNRQNWESLSSSPPDQSCRQERKITFTNMHYVCLISAIFLLTRSNTTFYSSFSPSLPLSALLFSELIPFYARAKSFVLSL